VRRHFELFVAAAERYRSDLAVTDDRVSITYAELLSLVFTEQRRITVGSLDLSSSVMLETRNTVESVAQLIALWSLGVDIILSEEISDSRLQGSGATHVCSADHVSEVANDSRFLRTSDSLQAFYTSGTEGQPKLVAHNSETLLSGLHQTIDVQHETIGADREEARQISDARLGLTLLTHMPIWSVAGFTVLQRALLVGEHVVMCEDQSVSHVLAQCTSKRVTNLSLSGFMAQQLSRSKLLTNLDCFIIGVGGSAVPAQVVRELESRSGCIVLVGYGTTETAGPVAMNRIDDPIDIRTGSIGRALPGIDLSLVDSDPELEDQEVRRLAVACNSIMVGYIAEGVLVRRSPGPYITGDLAVIDSKGYVTLYGRADRVILRGGKRIDPAEIELVALDHPDVVEAAVVGIPSRVAGEQDLLAFIVTNCSSDISPQLRSWLHQRLPNHKIPRRLRLVDEIPKSRSGKPNYIQLSASYGT
jgi:acyl-coenzyme A synthetase/AMP-(fatty) acid ligase